MARVPCDVEEIELEDDRGRTVESIRVICRRCDEETEAFGRTPASVRRCLAELRENCPMDERNFYEAMNGEDED